MNHGVENRDEFPHGSCERHLLEFSLRRQSLVKGLDRGIESRRNERRHVQREEQKRCQEPFI